MRTLIPVLGDQLSLDLSSLAGEKPANSVVLMMEVHEETTYVRHHRRKIAYILSAMRHHAADLQARGWTVDYVKLDDPGNTGGFTGEVARALRRHAPDRIVVTEPGEWRVAAMLDEWQTLFGLPVDVRPDTRFLLTHAEFDRWADGQDRLVMEPFYRAMRRRTGLLMDGDRPEGGRWNYDRENRKPCARDLLMPRPMRFKPDAITCEVLALVEARFAFGSLDHFDLAVTRTDALRQQRHFLDGALARFGECQDAMLSDEPFLYHSVLSPYLNSGLLDALELCREVEARYHAGEVPLAGAEGFTRQIIGWREYVRGIYWHEGPDFVRRNFFGNTRPLPAFYWTGDTDMHCLAQSIRGTIAHAYAHHIQRLMVTGNFALLIGADPAEVHRWYLEVYADAYEWVELPNTLGLSQYADGGLMGSKPYAASGAYINRMSDYCAGCRYDPARRVGEDACPFNALYWDFLARNEHSLRDNPRMAGPYRNWSRAKPAAKAETRAQAARFLAALDAAGSGY